MRLIYSSQIDDTVTYTPVSENANYPVENIYSQRLSKKYRTTGDTAESIIMDAGLGNTIKANSFTIAGHNFTSAATLHIQANAADAWGAPTLDETITWAAETIAAFFTLTDLRYWRFTMVDAANTDTYLEMGNLKLAEYLQITKGPARGVTLKKTDTTQSFMSGGGQYFATQGYTVRNGSLNFPHWTNAVAATYETMLDAVINAVPVVMVIDENNMDIIFPIYCIIAGNYDKTELKNGSYGW